MSKARRTARGVRKLWPVVLMGWERWQALPPERKEHYKRQARGYAERGRKALAERSEKRKRR
jgi:TRAP-type C4-dicarboxylate transport system substrate-binding protein